MVNKRSRDQFLEITMSREEAQDCTQCALLCCPGWLSVPGYFDNRKLRFWKRFRLKMLNNVGINISQTAQILG